MRTISTPVAVRVGLTANGEAEVDRAHDPVSELLVDQLLDRRTVDLDDLVEAVDGGIGRHRTLQGPSHRWRDQLRDRVIGEAERLGGGPGLCLVEGELTEQGRGGPLDRRVQSLGERSPCQPPGSLLREDLLR